MTPSEAIRPRDDLVLGAGAGSRALGLAPALAAACYPFLLDAFHRVVGPPGAPSPASAALPAGAILAAVLAVPAAGLVFAARRRGGPSARRLAYACVAAPTLYVFLGVVQAMAGSVLADPLVWCGLWAAAACWVWFRSGVPAPEPAPPAVVRWRVVHGVAGAVVLLYVGFHILNHLFGLVGPQAHAAVMELGRKVYRAPLVEPLLIALMIFQVASGLHLAWRWSAAGLDVWKTVQVASGAYLSVFILGHMNSVFLYAQTYLGIPTGWAFATGAPAGLIHDAWNIRLLPHYLLGVLFVLLHLSSGLRVVLIAHGAGRSLADRVWIAGACASAAVAVAVVAGMCGVRIPAA